MGWTIFWIYCAGLMVTLVLMVGWVVFYEGGDPDDSVVAVFIAFVWPVGLPMAVVIIATILTVRKLKERR